MANNPYGLSSAGVRKEEDTAAISAAPPDKWYQLNSLWNSVYKNPGDVWYDEEGEMHSKSPVAHAVAAIDNVLPGLPFVDVFPDPPEFDQPLEKLELAALGSYGGTMAAKAIRHPVETAKKVQKFGKSMYESYQGLKDIHDIVGIPGLAQMYQGYRKAYKWAKANPHKDLTPVRPSAQMLKTQAHDPGKSYIIGTDKHGRQVIPEELLRREARLKDMNQVKGERPKGFVPHNAKAAQSEGYVEFNKRKLIEGAENKTLMNTAAHEISHTAQGTNFGAKGVVGDGSWTIHKKGMPDYEKMPSNLKEGMGQVSDWKYELYNMLRPNFKKWHNSKINDKTVINRPDGTYSVKFNEQQRIGHFEKYLLGGDENAGLRHDRFGMEIQSRMAELRTILNIKNRDISKQEVVKRIKDALHHPQGHRLKTIREEFKSILQGESFGGMVSKLNYMLPGLAPVGMIGSLPETDDEFIEELSKFGDE